MSIEGVQLPVLAPSKGPSTVDEVRGKRQVMQAQAEQMDFTAPLPIEENSIDYGDQIQEKTPEEKVEEAKEANKQTISAKKAATLEKARAAKKEKARLLKLEQNNIGDVMNRLIPSLNEHFEKVNRRLDDLKNIIAFESSLQSQQVIPQGQEVIVESKAHPRTYIVQRNEAQTGIPIEDMYSAHLSSKRKRVEDMPLDEYEQRLYKRRTNPQFKYTPYETVESELRAAQNPEMGGRAGMSSVMQQAGTSAQKQYVMF